MSDKKISQLTSLVQADIATATDVLPIVDTSATETKKATPAAIVGAAAAAGLTNVDINSGAIDGTTVGASSASSGAFTTLSASGSVTLSGGTANGVLYLNGSKVATSGSALTFNGTSFGVGSSSYGDAGTIGLSVGVAGSTAGGLQLWASSLQEHYIQWGDSTTGSATYAGAISYSHTSDFMRFWVNSTERLRINSSGNVGIGTSSPTNTLSVAGNANITGNTTLGDASTDTVTVNGYVGVRATPASYYGISLGNSSTITGDANPRGISSSAVYGSDATGLTSALFGQVRTTAAAYTMSDAIGLRLDDASKGAGSTITNQHGVYVQNQTQGTNNYGITSLVSSGSNKWNIYASGTANNYFAGNVGIGTSAPSSNLEVSSGSDTVLTINAANNADAKLVFSEAGSAEYTIIMDGLSGSTQSLQFYNNRTATEAMRISSTGNVGIGTSSPSAPVEIVYAASGQQVAQRWRSGAGNVYGLDFVGNNADNGWGQIATYASGYLYWGVSATNGAYTERMRLTATGLGIGTSSPGQKLEVAGTIKSTAANGLLLQNSTSTGANYIRMVDSVQSSYFGQEDSAGSTFGLTAYSTIIYGNAAYPMIFATNGAERARITAGGDLLVGTTTSTSRFVSYRGDAGFNGFFDSPSGAGSGVYAIGTSLASTSNNANCAHLRCTTQGVATWELQGNGTSTFSSDERLKKNIQTARNGYLDDVEKLRVVKYNWHTDDDLTAKELGLIAQEVEQVFPGLVVEDSVPLGDVQNPKAIKTSVLPYILLKAIQELSAKNDALEARLAALEAK